MGRQGRRMLVALGLVLALSPAVAEATPTWLQPITLSAPPQPDGFFALGVGTPDLAFDGNGNVVAAWQKLQGGGNPAVVQVSARAAGGTFTPALDIAPTLTSFFG